MSFPLGSADAYLQQLRKQDHKKSHFLRYSQDEPQVHAGRACGDGVRRLSQERKDQSVFPNNRAVPRRPQWLAMDRMILRYFSYSHEGPIESRPEEMLRIRYFEIYFYLEDETIMIMERPDDRAEMKQGKLLNRQRVPKLNDPNSHMTMMDLNVNSEVQIFGRTHFIYKCDPFTRQSMTKMGINVPEDKTPPFSQHCLDAEAEKHTNHRLRRHINENQHMERFLQHDTEVLRFFAYWDDRERLFGDRHHLVIHYYLGDETTEVVRKVPMAYGKQRLEPFVRRCKLPKHAKDYEKVNLGSPWPVLNIVCSNPKRPETSKFTVRPSSTETYTEVDLRCGETVNIFSRPVFIYDCDAYTKWYYKEIYGVDMETIDVEEPAERKLFIIPPAYNGYGSEEDSLKNCAMLVPKPPTLNVRKYLLLDWEEGDPAKLIFKLRLVTTSEKNKDREFVMSFALADDSIYIYEKHVPQGVMAGTFHGKNAVKKSNLPDLPRYIQAEDLSVGGEFQFSGHAFIIVEVDECTASFMERYPQRFPFADATKIGQRFRKILHGMNADERLCFRQRFEHDDSTGNGLVEWDNFVTILMDLTKTKFTPHEYLTLARHYKFHNPVDRERLKQLFRALIQYGFRKNAFDATGNLKRAAIRADPDDRGVLSRAEFVRIVKACRAPINFEVLNFYLDVATSTDGLVNYRQTISDLDWINNSSKKLQAIPQNISKTFDFEKYFGKVVPSVSYRNFLLDVQD
ncbi:EF-hand domain-containing family member C2 [Hypsibius exemplaris]|uniref:EF-hand domain-containing family member C2 n=1 Tax=Hypsibius exemplaris TaxID=2072580 RepID=A0A1W0WG49_HYPEX|nr:EF-hand domain-containing family member C2 [Hypsibius exemplaris]